MTPNQVTQRADEGKVNTESNEQVRRTYPVLKEGEDVHYMSTRDHISKETDARFSKEVAAENSITTENKEHEQQLDVISCGRKRLCQRLVIVKVG